MIRPALPANFRPLPVLGTIRRAYELLWMHRLLQLRLALPGLILVTAGTALPTHTLWGLDQTQSAVVMQGLSARQVLPWVMALTLGSILTLSFSAAWRRFLLMDKPPTVFNFDAPFRHYLTLLVITNFVALLYAMLLAAVVQSLPGGWIILLIGLGGLLLTILRYSLLFTGALASDGDVTPRRAGALMNGNVLRYAAVWVLLTMSVLCIDNLLTFGLRGIGIGGGTIPGAVALGMVRGLTLVLTASLTSSAAALTYDFVVRGGGPVQDR